MLRKNAAKDWQNYYQMTGDRPPRETLMEALSRFDKEEAVGRAVDLGCGNGRDTIEILRRGWSVLAIDAQASAIETLKNRPELDELKTMLVTKVSRFENAIWSGVDFVNSSFALHCVEKRTFWTFGSVFTIAFDQVAGSVASFMVIGMNGQGTQQIPTLLLPRCRR